MLNFLRSLSAAQKGLAASFMSIVVIIVGSILFYVFPTPSNQGYAPEQPIPFSHRLHAGDNKIDCKYCHVTVGRSQHASIPSLNICMNCHQVVALNKPDIQRLHKYYREGKPIEWVRVHELPDHARFNHSRHIKKGVSCETCHGDVRTMDRVVQVAPLTMGWCLGCHRGRETPSKVMATVKKTKKDGEPVEEVAPFHCTTCHY